MGQDTSKVFDKKATAKRQMKSDTAANNAFQDNWLKIFGPPNYNNNFSESLSGYFNGQPMEQIAKNIAPHSAFHPQVKKVFRTVDDGGMFGGVLGKFLTPPTANLMGVSIF